jgi:cytidine deaminase
MLGEVLRRHERLPACVTARPAGLNHHHVALVVSCKTGRVVASGCNRTVADGTTATTVHAEVDALTRFLRTPTSRCERRRGVRVVSLRVARDGQLRMAKPCARCDQFLRALPVVRRIAWSDDRGDIVGWH